MVSKPHSCSALLYSMEWLLKKLYVTMVNENKPLSADYFDYLHVNK